MQFGHIDIPDDHIVAKTQFSFVFVNIRPFLKYHILISPLKTYKSLREMPSHEISDLFNTVKTCMCALEFYAHDFTASLQDGELAGQTVPHVHVHLVPRIANDLPENNDIYKKGALACDYDSESRTRRNRTYDEMKDEAHFLKEKFCKYFGRVFMHTLLFIV